jgi:hypothetical protein
VDARKRVIGLDVEALNEQVAEKQRSSSDKKEFERIESWYNFFTKKFYSSIFRTELRFMEIDRIMESAAEEEKLMKEFQKTQLRQSWDAAVKQKKEAIAAAVEPEFNPDATGASSAQCFSGEDRNRLQRLAEQKAQMARWVQDQVSEKTRLRLEQQGEDLKYSELMKAVDAIREAAEIEEKEMRNFLKTQVREENAKLAESQRVARRDPNASISREELLAATSLNLFDETAGSAMDATGHIIRRDMFKGYTDAQRKRILQENEEVARQAR